MQRRNTPIAILDACVLYPLWIRDVLLRFAEMDLYQPKWTDTILFEWLENLLINRPDLERSALERTVQHMNLAFEDALVSGFERHMNDIVLPDADDRHVCAAAIESKADLIVTLNLRDFPNSTLSRFNMRSVHPDDFLFALIQTNPEKSRMALQNMLNAYKNPPLETSDLVFILDKAGLRQTADFLTVSMRGNK